MRIQILRDKSFLVRRVYQKEFRIEIPELGLERARDRLRIEIRSYRFDLRELTPQYSATTQKWNLPARLGGVRYTNGAIFKAIKRKKLEVLNQSKKPKYRSPHVGVELEFRSSRDAMEIKDKLVEAGLERFVNLTSDSSIQTDGGDCDGSCRENCECFYCGETHHCEDEAECNRRDRDYGREHNSATWEYREDCRDCDETESIDGCDCGGKSDDGEPICAGEHIVCSGHCRGHSCAGSDDHENWDCNCECDCTSNPDGPYVYGHELRIIASRRRIQDVITRVCKVLNSECDVDINSSCGLHVHLDMRHRDHVTAYRNLVMMQKLLYSIVPKSRRENRFCQPNQSRVFGAVSGRYYGINGESYSRHKTIEIRIHSGSTNAVKINHWIQLLIAIADASPIRIAPRTVLGVKKRFGLSNELTEYIRNRIDQFASDHGSYAFDPRQSTEAPRAA